MKAYELIEILSKNPDLEVFYHCEGSPISPKPEIEQVCDTQWGVKFNGFDENDTNPRDAWIL